MQDDTVVTLVSLKMAKNNSNLMGMYLNYMRNIRNSCRKYMTRFKEEITPEMQTKWYDNLSDNIDPYIFIAGEFGAVFYPFGYGMIQYEDDKALLTGAIEDKYRGRGFGKKLFLELISLAKNRTDEIFLEVLDSNEVAKNLYKSIGFEFYEQKLDVITMRFKK